MREGLTRIITVSLLLAAPLARAEKEARPTATVLYPLRALGIAPETASALEATLRNEVASLPEVQLISRDVVSVSLANEREPDCLQRLPCAASAATRAGGRQFVSGTVSGLGDAVLVDLKLVDARSGQEVRRITHPINGRQELLIEILHAAAVELLAPARFVGRLDVRLVQSQAGSALALAPSSEVSGAQLYLDGKLLAQLPLKAPLEGIAPGKRALRVAKPGFRDASLFVEIRYDRTTEALVDLPRGELTSVAFLRKDEAPAPALEAAPPSQPLAVTAPVPPPRGAGMKIAGWSALGLGLASAAVGVALHVKAYQTSSGLNAREASNSLGPSDVPLYSDVNSEVNAARVLYTLAAVLGAGGGALLIWDHLDERRAELSAQPLVLPEGGGVGVSGKF